MSIFIDSSLIGGVSLARNPHLKANNEMISTYNEEEEKTWMLLLDCNNQYGHAMQQPLPYGGFSWDYDVEKYTSEYILKLSDNGEDGYMFEVDLEFSK